VVADVRRPDIIFECFDRECKGGAGAARHRSPDQATAGSIEPETPGE
jgi:hypothetical protein